MVRPEAATDQYFPNQTPHHKEKFSVNVWFNYGCCYQNFNMSTVRARCVKQLCSTPCCDVITFGGQHQSLHILGILLFEFGCGSYLVEFGSDLFLFWEICPISVWANHNWIFDVQENYMMMDLADAAEQECQQVFSERDAAKAREREGNANILVRDACTDLMSHVRISK